MPLLPFHAQEPEPSDVSRAGFFYKTDPAMGPPTTTTASRRGRSRASTPGKQAATGGAAKSVDTKAAATKHAALCRLANPSAKWRAVASHAERLHGLVRGTLINQNVTCHVGMSEKHEGITETAAAQLLELRGTTADDIANGYVKAHTPTSHPSPSTPSAGVSAGVLASGTGLHTCREACKAAGELKRKRPSLSLAEVAKSIHETKPFGPKPLSVPTVKKARLHVSDDGVQMSPGKHGPVPAFPPGIGDAVVAIVLEARKHGIRTGRSHCRHVAACLLQGTAAEAAFVVDGVVTMPRGWFGNFVRKCKHQLDFDKPDNRASTREEWEDIGNMKPHCEKFESAMLDEKIAIKNPRHDPESKEQDLKHVEHQRVLPIKAELHRVHSFDEVGWTPDLTAETNEKILTGKHDTHPKVHATKSARRMTFVGGCKMNGDDLPQFGTFPCKYERTWVENPPVCRQIHPGTNKPLEARCDHSKSGGMTNDLMIKYFHSIIAPSTHGCKNQTGKRHVQLTDSAGPHLFLDYLKLLLERGIIFIPRTPCLSHLMQNEDLLLFGISKINERKLKQWLQDGLLSKHINAHHGARVLGFQHTMQITAKPWETAMAEIPIVKSCVMGGHNPSTRLPMLKLAAKQNRDECKAEAAEHRRANNAAAAAKVQELDTPGLQALINSVDPKWATLPDLASITSKTKMPAHVFAQSDVSPSSAEAVALFDAKDAALKVDVATKETKKAARMDERAKKERRGHVLFQRITSAATPLAQRALISLSVNELKELGAYKKEPATWKKDDGSTITKKVDMIAYLAGKHPHDFAPEAPPGAAASGGGASATRT